MKNLKNKKAFSLVEMLVSLIVAGILVLTIGVISSISTGSYTGLTNEANIFNDITYSFKLMQSKVRSSSILSVTNLSNPWVGQGVNVATGTFGIYRNTTYTPPRREFSYDDGTNREVIFYVPDPNNSTLNLNFTATQNSKAVTVTLSGTNNNIPFNMSATILRRPS